MMKHQILGTQAPGKTDIIPRQNGGSTKTKSLGDTQPPSTTIVFQLVFADFSDTIDVWLYIQIGW